MPLQNRVDPFANLFRTTARGTMMGNRGGALHNDRREIVRFQKSRRWIACVLEFRGRRRTVMSPNRYTELFFLDEAVAFAAGHRPCAECRRPQFNSFRDAWRTARGTGIRPSADDMDLELHRARVGASRVKATFEAPLEILPDGSLLSIEGQPYLLWREELHLWTPEGYGTPEGYAGSGRRPNRQTVTVLTPEPIVACFRAGYVPQVHVSALRR